MADWYPNAKLMKFLYDGGSMLGGPPRYVQHTTETNWLPNYGGQASPKAYAPHFTIELNGKVLQHTPISRAARALRNEPGGVQTNRQGTYCVQTELVGWAKNGSNIPIAQVNAVTELVAWVMEQTKIPPLWISTPRGGGHCYGRTSTCRMSSAQWNRFTGLTEHARVPENTHWDCGDWRWEKFINEGDGMGHDTHDYSELVELHKAVPIPTWAESDWKEYVADGGTTIPASAGWPAFRMDLGFFRRKFVAPLNNDLAVLRKEAARLEERVAQLERDNVATKNRLSKIESSGPASGLQSGDVVRLTKET